MSTSATYTQEYRVELLGNGFVRVDHRGSGLVGLFYPDGTPRSGDLARGRLAYQAADAVRRYTLDITGGQ